MALGGGPGGTGSAAAATALPVTRSCRRVDCSLSARRVAQALHIGKPVAAGVAVQLGDAPQVAQRGALRGTLEAAGVEFIDGDAPGVRLQRTPEASG